jgi:hypothetical protein
MSRVVALGIENRRLDAHVGSNVRVVFGEDKLAFGIDLDAWASPVAYMAR